MAKTTTNPHLTIYPKAFGAAWATWKTPWGIDKKSTTIQARAARKRSSWVNVASFFPVRYVYDWIRHCVDLSAAADLFKTHSIMRPYRYKYCIIINAINLRWPCVSCFRKIWRRKELRVVLKILIPVFLILSLQILKISMWKGVRGSFANFKHFSLVNKIIFIIDCFSV